MIAWRISLASIFLLVATLVTSCGELSCSPGPTGSASTSAPAATAGDAGVNTPTTFPPTTATAPTTTTASSTTTTSTTTTTLSPMEAYRAAMRVWKNKYGAELEDSYTIISTMRGPAHPSPEEIQAAVDLDRVLAETVDELEDIQPPPHLSARHAPYLASMREMPDGAHDLAEAMKAGKALRTVTAMATLAVQWEKGEPARTALESALGFSLSG